MDQENGYAHGQCFDVDECQSIPGLCQQKCVNFWGGYRCTCNQGYELSHDNRTCNDIDECEVHKDYKLCMGFCINTPGSYQCSCPRGYTLASDKTSCRDIDECDTTSNNHVCTGRVSTLMAVQIIYLHIAYIIVNGFIQI
ncbi:PREDICTED: fibulin-1-like [Drosophila arizonae]|uniref:Fibulin-1-like n=1 Tax=Drosophila arizonae TaxID=7263 RepID=A0ABM1Q0D6_DROAR|nr:PREDICTED: fibulin-1-like [Drosophila arizonae]